MGIRFCLGGLWLGTNTWLGSSSTLFVVTDNTMAHRSCSDYSRDIAQIRWVSQQQLEIGVLNVNPFYVPPRIVVSLQYLTLLCASQNNSKSTILNPVTCLPE